MSHKITRDKKGHIGVGMDLDTIYNNRLNMPYSTGSRGKENDTLCGTK